MKKYLKFPLALILATSLANAEETKKPQKPQTLDIDNIVWVYEVHAELPTSPKKLAGFVSADYSNASDEFERHELLQQIKPIIKKRIEKAKEQKLYSLKVNVNLDEYDFERKGFSTGFSESTYLTHGGRYASRFAAIEGIDFIPVAKEKAQSIIKGLQYRRSVVEVIGNVEEVKDRSVDGYMRKTVYIWPQKIILYGGKDQKKKVIEIDLTK